jgi:Fe-S-cluster containining protein
VSDGLLDEYRAAVAKIDATCAPIAQRRAADLACARGCARCCTAGLTVLSVEAEAIVAHLEEHGISARPAPPPGGCDFLDAEGACTIYDARPVVCRSHGLPVRMKREAEEPARGELRVLGDVEVCALNFTEREPEEQDVLDGERLSALMLVVEQRFRERLGEGPPLARVALADIADALELD